MRPDGRREAESKQREVRERRNSMLRTFEQRQAVVLRDYRHSRWTPGTILWLKLDPCHTQFKYNVTLGGKWRRHADQIHSSNIPIKQDTDIQFNKPTVKSTILPLD